MGYYSSSGKAVAVVLVTMLLLIFTITVEPAKNYRCDGEVTTVTSGACNGYYDYCVTSLINALVTATTNSRNRVDTRSYPPDYPSGGIAGTANCAYSATLAECQDCLGDALTDLGSSVCTSYATGTYVGDVCSMSFKQILP
ncbi:hypothetical protein LINPERPRIM_LOCUS23479 [Linum perenne]